MWDAECDRRQSALIEKAGLPAKLPAGVDVEEILNTLQLDKKVQDGYDVGSMSHADADKVAARIIAECGSTPAIALERIKSGE